MRRRHTLFVVLPACAAVLGIVPMAARADVIPAPPSQASGVAARVGSLVDISRTGATAGADTSSAEASVVRLGGEPLLDLGGTQTGDGQSAGSLVDTGDALPARVEVAPWEAKAQSSGSTRQSNGSAAVARAEVPDVADAGVLTSESQATHTDRKSTGTSVTEGFQLGVLDAIRLVLLHSEATSEGQGHSYLAGVNGTEIGTDDQLGSSPLCALDAPGLLSLSCLTASGGNGAVGDVYDTAAQVAEVNPALEALAPVAPVSAFTAAATSGTGQETAPAVTETTPTAALGAETSRETAPAAAAPADSDGIAGVLARTGTAAAPMFAAAAVLILLGLALRRFRTGATAA